jgi:uncharacterized protein
MPEPDTAAIRTAPHGVDIHIYVAPRSSSNKVVGLHNGALKVALTAPPVDGAANKALVEFLAKTLGVPKSGVTIVSGETSRNKTLRVAGISVEDARARLGPLET